VESKPGQALVANSAVLALQQALPPHKLHTLQPKTLASSCPQDKEVSTDAPELPQDHNLHM
jgi:hypothetical protein